MDKGSWQLLGIAPTGDRGAIRRAYAGQLKAIDSGVDPEGFRRLRLAYETALQGAAWTEERGGSAAAGLVPEQFVEMRKTVPAAPGPATPTAPASVKPKPRSRTKASGGEPGQGSAENIRRLIRERRPLEAAAAWSASTELSLRDTRAISEELAARAIDPEIDLSTLERLIEAMGWREAATDRLGSPALVAVMQRQLAELWLSGLITTAARRVWWPGLWSSRITAARLVLQPAPGWFERQTPWTWSTSGLTYWMPGIRRHRKWLGGRLDAARIAWCETAASQNQTVLLNGVMRAFRFYLLWNAALLGIGALRGFLSGLR